MNELMTLKLHHGIYKDLAETLERIPLKETDTLHEISGAAVRVADDICKAYKGTRICMWRVEDGELTLMASTCTQKDTVLFSERLMGMYLNGELGTQGKIDYIGKISYFSFISENGPGTVYIIDTSEAGFFADSDNINVIGKEAFAFLNGLMLEYRAEQNTYPVGYRQFPIMLNDILTLKDKVYAVVYFRPEHYEDFIARYGYEAYVNCCLGAMSRFIKKHGKANIGTYWDGAAVLVVRKSEDGFAFLDMLEHEDAEYEMCVNGTEVIRPNMMYIMGVLYDEPADAQAVLRFRNDAMEIDFTSLGKQGKAMMLLNYIIGKWERVYADGRFEGFNEEFEEAKEEQHTTSNENVAVNNAEDTKTDAKGKEEPIMAENDTQSYDEITDNIGDNYDAVFTI